MRAVLDIGERDVLVSAAAGEAAESPEIGEVHVYRVPYGAPEAIADEAGADEAGETGEAHAWGPERVSEGVGVHSAVRAGGVTVLASARPDVSGSVVQVVREGKQLAVIASYAQQPNLTPRVQLTEGAHTEFRAPSSCRRGIGRRTVRFRSCWIPMRDRTASACWPRTIRTSRPSGSRIRVSPSSSRTARQSGPLPGWEKAVKNNLPLTLDDQIEALQALAGRFPLDQSRVAIRGWSYGGYLAGLAALRRPDIFHAAIAGAPVTDWRLYDTHYTERYLGHPSEAPEVYAVNSLVTDDGLAEPASQARPIMIIHGLADDNVVMTHTLRLSSALLSAGRRTRCCRSPG